MNAASIAELKKVLVQLDHGELLEACLRMARFKKDNKELLTYLFFMSHDEPAFIRSICLEIDELFSQNLVAHKKTLRKIIRWMDKWIRFSGNKETEAEIRLHFCRALIASKTPYRKNRVMTNMYLGQLKKIRKATEKFHSDLQHDYEHQIHLLES